jgi:AcrR family transcriptional regulator
MTNLRKKPARPRTKPPRVRREELLDAAENLFLARGIAATSVDAIVAGAGVAKGTFYLHFASKEQLLAALRQRFIDDFCSDIGAAVDRCRADDWRGRLGAWIAAGVGGYLDHHALHELVFHEFRPEHRHTAHGNSTVDQLALLLAAGNSAGAWSVEDPSLNATMLFHALHAALDEAAARKSNADRRKLVRALQAFFERALALPAGAVTHRARGVL